MADALVMDRTTLTRNLKPLVKDGLLAVEPGADRRSRWVRLTPKGRKTLAEALPLCQRGQDRVVEGLGRERWQRLVGDLGATVALTQGR
jgi:DNA-binding MarR family transcriptional regulator